MAGLTAKDRTKQLEEWIKSHLDYRVTYPTTADTFARLATRDLDFKVAPNTMFRALQKMKITFHQTAADPPGRTFSKLDILKGKVKYLEGRIEVLEEEVKKLKKK